MQKLCQTIIHYTFVYVALHTSQHRAECIANLKAKGKNDALISVSTAEQAEQ